MNEIKGIAAWVSGKKGKWVTLGVWVIVVALLTVMLPGVFSQENNNAENLSNTDPSIQAEAIAQQEFTSGTDVPALLVWKRAAGLTTEDLQNLQALTQQLDEQPLEHQTAVVPLYRMPLPAVQAQLSEDKTTIVFPVLFDQQADAEALKESTTELKEMAAAQFGTDPFAADINAADELTARVTGPVGITIDATELFKDADISLLIATVLIVLIILLLIYRSPILATIPIIAVGFAFLATSPILGYMAQQGWITVDAQAISIMTVLLFGAGTDYCLFLISAYRHELMDVADKRKALLRAFKSSAGGIAMSGFTVVLSLFALLLAKYGAYERFAIPFSLSILIMGIASLTLVPALLAIFGRGSFYPFIPRTPEMQIEHARKKGKTLTKIKTNKSENRVGRFVVRRPWIVIVATIALLGGLATFAPQVKYTYDILSSFPSDMESREGFTVIGEQFSPGELAPVKIMIDTEGNTTNLKDALAGLDYVDMVSEPQQGSNNPNIVAYDVNLSMNPYSMEAMQHIPDLRAVAEQSLQAAGIDAAADKVWISGQTATQYDAEVVGEKDTNLIIPAVIVLIAILLLAYLRSVVATIYLIATVVLSFFSALGLGWLILHYGFGVEAIQGSIPLYAFVFLVALGEDYNIFMISRIWQKSKTMPLKQAISEGVGETGSVITSAGIILAGTFAVLATLPIQVLVQFGTVTALGVLLDTFIVRPLLVPAITKVLGPAAFWPSKRHMPVETPVAAEKSESA